MPAAVVASEMKGEKNDKLDCIEDYDIGVLLGRGGFASVYRARERKTMEDVAIKFISKSQLTEQSMYERVLNEIRIHSKLDHHAIVKVLRHFEDNDFFYIVLELCSNGNLYRHIKNRGCLDERVASKYCFQLLEALQYLQINYGVIHRDLKLSNILLDENFHVKLCDFGLAAQLEHPDEEHFTICGTPNYIAPEVASQQSHGFPADLWSLGCLLYSMLTGAPPFEQGGVRETLQSIVDGKYSMPAHISPTAQDFLRSLLLVNPSSRLNVKQTKSHPFLTRQREAEDNKKIPPHLSAPQVGGNNNTNGSFATTALVSYDGRIEADNRTTTNGDVNYVFKYGEHNDESSTFNSEEEIYPQQLRLIPEQQHSLYDLHAPVTVLHPQLLSKRKSEEQERVIDHTPLMSVSSVPCTRQQLRRKAEEETHLLRKSHPSTSPLSRSLFLNPPQTPPNKLGHGDSFQDDVYREPRAHYATKVKGQGKGSILFHARRSGGYNHSLAVSLDSSLHGSPSTDKNSSYLTANTPNSSMTAADFSFSRSSSGLVSSVESSRGRGVVEAVSLVGAAVSPSRRLWVSRQSNRYGHSAPEAWNQEFCYCAPRGDVLIMSRAGDVVYLTYLRDKSNKLRPCRVSVRACNPLKLLIGKVTQEMCQEIRDIRAASLKSSDCDVVSEKLSSDDTNSRGSKGNECCGGVGGFIGKDKFPDRDLDILSDKVWLASYHITKLPTALKKTYVTVARMLDAVKCKLPKLILYLTESENSKGSDNAPDRVDSSGSRKAVCKCMIMCNDPLPDFSVRWADGTKLKYSLSDGKLHITNNKGNLESQYRWEGFASNDADWTESAPKSIRKYLLLAQAAMRRCIAEDVKHQENMEATSNCTSSHGGSEVNIVKKMYPIILVDCISNT